MTDTAATIKFDFKPHGGILWTEVPMHQAHAAINKTYANIDTAWKAMVLDGVNLWTPGGTYRAHRIEQGPAKLPETPPCNVCGTTDWKTLHALGSDGKSVFSEATAAPAGAICGDCLDEAVSQVFRSSSADVLVPVPVNPDIVPEGQVYEYPLADGTTAEAKAPDQVQIEFKALYGDEWIDVDAPFARTALANEYRNIDFVWSEIERGVLFGTREGLFRRKPAPKT